MPKYTVKVRGEVVKFRARNDADAKLQAFRINPFYSDLKRLESRWWLLVYVLVFLLCWYGFDVTW